MATNNDTTNHTALSELAARAKRMGFEVHEQIGDDEREWRYRLVGPNVTDAELADMLDKLGAPAETAPAEIPQYGEVGHTLAARVSEAEREAARALDSVDYDRLTVDQADAIAVKFDEIAELARQTSQPAQTGADAGAGEQDDVAALLYLHAASAMNIYGVAHMLSMHIEDAHEPGPACGLIAEQASQLNDRLFALAQRVDRARVGGAA